jgi:hypothetical protein
MAILIISAAVPCIGELMAFKPGDRVFYYRVNFSTCVSPGFKKGIIKSIGNIYGEFKIKTITESNIIEEVLCRKQDIKLDIIGTLKYLKNG